MRKQLQAVKAAIAAAAILGSVIPAEAMPWTRPNNSLTITGDRGGQLVRYALRAKQMKKQGQKVRFAGRCDSACTLYLTLPKSQTCVTPRASFGFHKPYGASPRGNSAAAGYMMASYPGWVRSWIRAHGGLTVGIKTMPYKYAVRYLPKCEGNSRFSI